LKYLLDTNFVSQLIKAKAVPGVLEWFELQDESDLLLSAPTIMEIRAGIEVTQPGLKRQVLEHWLSNEIVPRFAGRILPIDDQVADAAGRLLGKSQLEGWKMEAMDALIGATALAHGMTLATLNKKHFDKSDIKLLVF
jgi:predicted nucleic acid-binding protein